MTEPVTVVEVGPRDGLQNECAVLSTEVKLAFVRSLASAGLSRIEVAAFVRPDLFGGRIISIGMARLLKT